MIATYRIQLTPDFGFDAVRDLVPYFKRLGISHLYLSPITEARIGSTHGYDVMDHNAVREEFGGRAGFDRLLAAVGEADLQIILDYVPNHAGVGPRNRYWQDVLAYGPFSPYAPFLDIDWQPIKVELQEKILLPFLGTTYGEALDSGEIGLVYDDGRFYATYYERRFQLNPTTYGAILERVLEAYERTNPYWELKDLYEAYHSLAVHERDKAEALRMRLLSASRRVALEEALDGFQGEALHALLERQYWRLSYWKTAGYEINYRRFFDINSLVALRMEDPQVFWETHRLLGELLAEEGVAGVRIDHIDGLFDPHGYLERLSSLGAGKVWVEKILAPGEILPEAWPVEGTTGYEFLNDVMGVLVQPEAELALDRSYRRFAPDATSFEDVTARSKRQVMETALSSELFRLSYELDRLSEADYHTRDFTLEALRAALTELIAAFDRYRTYLPYDEEEARRVVHEAVHRAIQRNPGTEHSVYHFIGDVILGNVREDLRVLQEAWTGRFQQYSAPVAAKGVEDTAFYRYLRLVALNEVGGEPGHFGQTVQAFHSRARFRAHRYPLNLLATATHDHKRGEDTRMRLIALTEVPEQWEHTLQALSTGASLPAAEAGIARADVYLFCQTLAALWHDADRAALADRMWEYMLKAVRERKVETSWLSPNESYEAALHAFVTRTIERAETDAALAALSAQLFQYGFFNTLSQVVLKFTTPGVPDVYQGCELLDVSLVDPDNRRPVDYALRQALLDELEGLIRRPEPEAVQALLAAHDARAKLYFTARLLRLRGDQADLFAAGDYRPLDVEGPGSDHYLAFLRTHGADAVLVVVPRFPSTWEAHREASVILPPSLSGVAWRDVLGGQPLRPADVLQVQTFPLPWAVLTRTPQG